MNLYLVRHAEAKHGAGESERGLSEKGAADMEKVARFAAGAGVKVGLILHSGKTRAKETAQILGRHLKPEKGVNESDALTPDADPWVWAERVSDREDDLMLVGHMPYMEGLASLLVAGDINGKVVEFRTGSIVSLRRECGKWSVAWMVTPEIVG